MNKNILIVAIIVFFIQSFGLGLMLYGINNNEKFTWIGFGVLSIGLMVIGIGLIFTGFKRQKKE